MQKWTALNAPSAFFIRFQKAMFDSDGVFLVHCGGGTFSPSFSSMGFGFAPLKPHHSGFHHCFGSACDATTELFSRKTLLPFRLGEKFPQSAADAPYDCAMSLPRILRVYRGRLTTWSSESYSSDSAVVGWNESCSMPAS